MQFLRRDRPCDLDQGRLSRIPPDDARAGLNGSDVLDCLEAQTRGGGRLPAFQASRMAFEDRSGHFPGCDPMSAVGQTRTSARSRGMSVLPSGTDIVRLHAQVLFVPRSDIAGLV